MPLRLAATDNLSPAVAIQMRLSGRSDFAGTAWQPFATTATWDFSGGPAVYAQFRDAAGNLSAVANDALLAATDPCTPRPPVTINAQPSNGALAVTVSATGPNNGLRALRFESLANASIDVGSQKNQATPFAVSIPAGQEPASIPFVARRQSAGQSTTVRLVVVDGRGEWSTFVGGGPSAF